MLKAIRKAPIFIVTLFILIIVFLLLDKWQKPASTIPAPIKVESKGGTILNTAIAPIKKHSNIEVDKQHLASKILNVNLPKSNYVLPQENAPVDLIGGLYIKAEKAPESTMQQDQTIDNIGYFDPNSLPPEYGYENVPLGKGPMDINKNPEKYQVKER